MRLLLAIALAGLAAQAQAVARPVSYVDGWTVISETDRQSTALWVHYTLDPQLSLGWRSEWDRRAEFQVHGPQITYLAKRWFGADYQANLYGFAGGGWAQGTGDNEGIEGGASYLGLMADWETRRLFTSYRMRVTEAGVLGSYAMQAARVGFAPYVGQTGDLHTWLMLELDHRPQNDDTVGVTPLVRFFKGAALLELGWSIPDSQPLANFTYRF
ncbi:MAG: hypothetical protein HRU11_09005 [Parvularculaceae bacterium]|nr:hypothetical protein [Parvularculaceae bacterium]